MTDKLFTWVLALPLGIILGWIAGRLFGPSVDALGQGLLNLLSTLVNKKNIAEEKYLELVTLIRNNHLSNGHRVFYEKKAYLHDKQIISLLRNSGFFLRRAIKDEFIEDFQINSYNDSDVFFAAMEIFINKLGGKDVQKIFQKHKENNQAALWPFLGFIGERKPKLLSGEVVGYLRNKQKEWKASVDKS